MLGKAAGVAGLAYGGAKVVEGQLQQAQEYSALTGGTSVAESAGYELQARVMAISPFMNDEQSRQLIQETLRRGHQGEQADTVMKFMSQNFKEMGLSFKESGDLYDSVIQEAGGSVEGLAGTLDSLRMTAKDTGSNVQELTKSFAAAAEQWSGYGAGSGAATIAGVGASVFVGVREPEGVNTGWYARNTP